MFYRSGIFHLLIVSFVLWGALFFNSIESTVSIWYRSDTFAHCFIIFPICIYLIKLKWAKLHKVEISQNYYVLLFMLPVLALWLIGSLAQVLVVEQASAFLMLPMIIWCVMGNQVARVLLFAFVFWMFSVPAGEFMIPQLQELTADITVSSLQLTRVPVYREGLYIAIPGGLFEVAVACSGIRYLIASFTLGTLFAYLNYNSAKKRTIFILFSIFLPLIANGIRAYGIVMIAYLSDMKYATGVDHLIYGWIFFGVVILIMFAVGGRWADPVKAEDNQPVTDYPKISFVNPMKGIIVAACVIGFGLLYKTNITSEHDTFTPDFSLIFTEQNDIQDTSWFPVFKKSDNQLSGNKEGIDYFLAYYNQDSQTPGKELINSVNRIFNIKYWSIVESGEKNGHKFVKITNAHGQNRLLVYTYVTEWLETSSALKVKLSQTIQALLGSPQRGFVFVMSVPLDSKEDPSAFFEQKVSATMNDSLRDLLIND